MGDEGITYLIKYLSFVPKLQRVILCNNKSVTDHENL